SLRLTAHLTGASGRPTRLRTLPISLDADARAVVEQLLDRPFGRARLSVWPCLHVPCDVHGLGMMLVAGLAAGPEMPASELAAAFDEVRRQLFAAARSGAGPAALAREATRLLQRATEAGPLHKRQLFADPTRHAHASDAVPDTLWLDVLLVAL